MAIPFRSHILVDWVSHLFGSVKRITTTADQSVSAEPDTLWPMWLISAFGCCSS